MQIEFLRALVQQVLHSVPLQPHQYQQRAEEKLFGEDCGLDMHQSMPNNRCSAVRIHIVSVCQSKLSIPWEDHHVSWRHSCHSKPGNLGECECLRHGGWFHRVALYQSTVDGCEIPITTCIIGGKHPIMFIIEYYLWMVSTIHPP